MENGAIIVTIGLGLFGLVFAILAIFNNKQSGISKEVNDVKYNYIQRFDNLEKMVELSNQISQTSAKKIQEICDGNKKFQEEFSTLVTEHKIRVSQGKC